MHTKTLGTYTHAPAPGMADLARSAFRFVSRAMDRQRQRHHLADLTDAQLDDIGVSRAEAMREAGRPFWA